MYTAVVLSTTQIKCIHLFIYFAISNPKFGMSDLQTMFEHALGVAQWCSGAVPPRNKEVLGSIPDQKFARSPRFCMGLPRVLRFPPALNNKHVRLGVLLPLPLDQGTGLRPGVGPQVLPCGYPVLL